MQKYFYTKFSVLIQHIFLHKSVWFYSINLTFGEVVQHQSQYLLFPNPQLKVSNIFLCSCCFQLTATWLSFHCWPMLINPFTDCFHWAKLPTFCWKFCNGCLVFPKPSSRNVSIRALSLHTITKPMFLPNCDYD